MTDIIYPGVTVQLTGEDGNAMSVIATVRRALRQAGAPPRDLEAFSNQAMSGNYINVLRTAMAWVNVE